MSTRHREPPTTDGSAERGTRPPPPPADKALLPLALGGASWVPGGPGRPGPGQPVRGGAQRPRGPAGAGALSQSLSVLFLHFL